MKPTELVDQLLAEDAFPFSVTAGAPAGWSSSGREPRKGNFVSIKTGEARGIPAATLKKLGLDAGWATRSKDKFNYDFDDDNGPKWDKKVKAYTSAGAFIDDKINYNTFKPTGLVLEFPAGVDGVAQAKTILNQYYAHAKGESGEREQHRAEAPARKKAAAKIYRGEYEADRKKLYAQYGEQNVKSVSARQFNGDDGYQWAVFIGNRPIVNGLTQAEVNGYKHKAYADLLAQNGKH